MDIIVVNDTNVFIDLYCIGLLETFFRLAQQVHTTDFVVNELVKDDQRKKVEEYVKSGRLFVKRHTAEELMDILRFQQMQDNNVSLTDCSVWLYAQNNRYRLLTGDNKLRKSAIQAGTVVSGILYVFDQLVEQRLITPQEACDKLTLLRSINNRLPDKDIGERLRRWKDCL
ncbi:MAG: hypothetical protein K2O69_05270 [Odoribacter sp.]|nr:hypothetical protein [Odoribacter sp.]